MGPQCASIGCAGLCGVTSTPPKMGQESRPQGWESRPGGLSESLRIHCAEHVCNNVVTGKMWYDLLLEHQKSSPVLKLAGSFDKKFDFGAGFNKNKISKNARNVRIRTRAAPGLTCGALLTHNSTNQTIPPLHTVP